MLGKNIRARRRPRSQAWLANVVGVSRVAVSQWERGFADPTLENLRAIARALDCTIDDLVGTGESAA